MHYTVFITTEANKDIMSVIDYLSESCCAPLTAVRLYEEIISKIRSLELYADIYSPVHYKSLSIYGAEVYRINCKGFAIIYTIEFSAVLVHRIVHGKLIT